VPTAPTHPVGHVLVVALDVPYPDDYGGAKDTWRRVRLLARHGYALSLVATYKDERRRATFESSPESRVFRRFALVRSRPWRGVASLYPYAVGSRTLSAARAAQVVAALGRTTFDVVEIEGLQALGTFLSLRSRLRYRKALLRPFNRESAYQLNQASSEPRALKRALLRSDAGRFYLFERFGRWRRAVDATLFISSDEIDHPNFTGLKCRMLVPPPALPDGPPSLASDFALRDDLLLYVGNLRLADNRAAAVAAHRELRHLLNRHGWRLAVCGRSDDPEILGELRADPRVTCRFNLTAAELSALYARAKMFVCFSENRAGAKLKLWEAIQEGVPVLANENAVAGSSLASAVLLYRRGDPTAERALVELMTSAERWQAFRASAYETWRDVNERATAEYLRAFE
jgi:hypothetical protein